MTPSGDPHEARLDELYGLPLERFTAARDELARRLRKQGDRGAAERVKAVRKPSLVAWSLNQVRRHDRERIEQLLAAGEGLRDAQKQLLAGGEHGLLREAVARERSLVEQVAGLAERELAGAGHPASANLQDKLWQTLHAAARDAHTRDLLHIGRLVREGQVTEFGLGAAELDLAEVAAHSRAQAAAPAQVPARRSAALERKLKSAQGRLEQARSRQHELQEKLDHLERRAADAHRDAARAAAAAERAESSAETGRSQVRAAAARADQFEAALAELKSEA